MDWLYPGEAAVGLHRARDGYLAVADDAVDARARALLVVKADALVAILGRTSPEAALLVDDPEIIAEAVGLRPADAGANVLLLVPDDDYPFEDAWADEGIRYAALPQVVADLLTGPGRGPAEGEALLDWMTENPEVWRGCWWTRTC